MFLVLLLLYHSIDNVLTCKGAIDKYYCPNLQFLFLFFSIAQDLLKEQMQ